MLTSKLFSNRDLSIKRLTPLRQINSLYYITPVRFYYNFFQKFGATSKATSFDWMGVGATVGDENDRMMRHEAVTMSQAFMCPGKNLPYTPDFLAEVGLNLPFGLVTSCCSCQTA